ncbi:MAG: hypothetical protein K0S81_1935 [Rhodospirillales bacterium]|jgi:hypothetical protein|nr:hypothetical protein [Rhodospirillales bacterium]
MSGTSLRDFVSRAVEHKRIRFGDLRRLQRDILPARITGLEQAEVLIALDSSVDRTDREWRRYLVSTIRDFVIWGSTPVGRIDGSKAAWLTHALLNSSPKTARAIWREVIKEAPQMDENVHTRSRQRGTAPTYERSSSGAALSSRRARP